MCVHLYTHVHTCVYMSHAHVRIYTCTRRHHFHILSHLSSYLDLTVTIVFVCSFVFIVTFIYGFVLVGHKVRAEVI